MATVIAATSAAITPAGAAKAPEETRLKCSVPPGWIDWKMGEPFPNGGDVNIFLLAKGDRRFWNGIELKSAGQAAYFFSEMTKVRGANLIFDPGDADCDFVQENVLLVERFGLCQKGACLFGTAPPTTVPAPLPSYGQQ